jgi:hypothetical protein
MSQGISSLTLGMKFENYFVSALPSAMMVGKDCYSSENCDECEEEDSWRMEKV